MPYVKEHQRMLKKGKAGETKKPAAKNAERGYMPYEEASEAIPPEDVSTEQLDSIISLFGDGELDIDITDTRHDSKTRQPAEDELEEGAEGEEASLDEARGRGREEEVEVGVGNR
jgi:hypothetical protein